MDERLTPRTIANDPACATTRTELRNGEHLTLRSLRHDDTDRLSQYFAGLSAETRGWFAPHDFTTAAARSLCEAAGSDETLRMVAVTESDEPEIVGYFILQFGARGPDAARFNSYGVPLDDDTDCTLAPSVADSYQGAGLGSAMMRHLIGIARRARRSRMVLFGGVNTANRGAIHFYEKFGFRTVARFGSDTQKVDMILDLTLSEGDA